MKRGSNQESERYLNEKASPFRSVIVKLRFCENATNFLRNHHLRFEPCSASQIYGGDFAKF